MDSLETKQFKIDTYKSLPINWKINAKHWFMGDNLSSFMRDNFSNYSERYRSYINEIYYRPLYGKSVIRFSRNNQY